MSTIFNNNYKRVSDDHVLDLNIGFDQRQRESLLLISTAAMTPSDQDLLISSYAIEIFYGFREDNLYTLSFSLKDTQYQEFFNSFCTDVINSSKKLSNEKEGMHFIATRYGHWMQFFSKDMKPKLSIQKVKGLLGELIILKEKLIPEFGFEKAVKSWIGSEGADQDFRFDDTWIEVKTTSTGNTKVKIASFEQLDTPNEGDLYLVYLDTTSLVDAKSLDLNTYITSIEELLPNLAISNLFLKELHARGYCNLPEYSNYKFRYNGCNSYHVDSHFPALRRGTSIPSQIVNAVYQLELQELKANEVSISL